MDDFTASNIAVSDEKREEELEKKTKGTVDHTKLKEDIAAARQHCSEVLLTPNTLTMTKPSWRTG